MIYDKMPEYCVERASKMLSSRFKKSMNGAKVLVLGIAYKNDIDDYRESPALRVIEELEEEQVTVLARISSGFIQKNKAYYDPLKDFMSLNRAMRKSIKERDEILQPLYLEQEYRKIDVLAIYR